MKIEVDGYIPRPPGEVFEALCDVTAWPERISAITRVEVLTPDIPFGAGFRFDETRKMGSREETQTFTVDKVEIPHLFQMTSEAFGTRFVAWHKLQPENDGTRLHLGFEGIPQTFLAKLMMPLAKLMEKSTKAQLQGDMDDLIRALTTEA